MDRAKEIFLEALDVVGPARMLMIDRDCRGDDSLRARVLSLISAHDRAAKMIVEPTVHPWTTTLTAGQELHPPGSSIGPYLIQRKLGEGGFGTVYLARQEEPVRRPVALKIIKPGMDSADFIRRFELERQALAVMDHPGIAKVFAAGTTETGRPYFAMEYVNGLPINEFCDANRLSIADRLRLLDVVCLAVQHAHGRGVIHRDLKPSNILVSMLDGKPFATIIDFGIAKALHKQLHAHATITLPQQIIGTPQFMSPEQARLCGDDDIDTRADVYSLGAILYELLTGCPLFDSEKLRSLRASDLERLICDVDPARPSARVAMLGERADKTAEARGLDPSRLARALTGDLDWICMRALEKDRERRYATALSLAEDLRRYLADEPVQACPPTLSYRVGKFARRHRREFAAGAVVAVALVAFTIGSAFMAVREHRAKSDAQRQLKRANALANFAQDILSGVDPAEARGMDTQLIRKILASAEARVSDQLADQPDAASSMLNAIGYAQLQIANYSQAEPMLRKAIELAISSQGPDSNEAMRPTENLGSLYVETSRLDDAEKLLTDLLARRRRVLGNEHPETIVTAGNLAYVFEKRGRWKQAREMFADIAAFREKTLGPDDEQTLTSLNNLANCLDNLGELEQAAAMYERVLAGQRVRNGADHPRTLLTMNNLASAYRSINRPEDARTLFEQTMAIKIRVYGPDHPSTIITSMNLASMYVELGRLDEAEKMYRHAAEIAMSGAVSTDIRVAALNGLGLIAKNRGRLDEAEDYVTQAVEQAKKVMGEKHPNMIVLLGNLASMQYEAGHYQRAEQTARQAIAVAAETVGLGHYSVLTPRRLLARALAQQGHPADAAEILRDVMETMDKMPPNIRNEVKREAAKFYAQAGNTERAGHYRRQLPATMPATRSSVW